jgi:AcrR family transcriptional regulator
MAVPTGAARRGRPPVSEQRRGEQRLHISRQAVRLFREQGLAATSGEQIAAAAGVSERTLWRHFRTKESCVEPLLTRTTDEFEAMLRSWPPGVGLAAHLRTEYLFMPDASRADVDAVLAVIRMARTDPAVRAVWLLVNERRETTFAEVLGARTGAAPGAFEVRARAASVNAVLRVVTEDLAWASADGPGAEAAVGQYRDRLAQTLREHLPAE